MYEQLTVLETGDLWAGGQASGGLGAAAPRAIGQGVRV